MEWKEISESGKENPCKIIEREIQGFSNASKDLLELEINKKNKVFSKYSVLKSNFQFSLMLRSKFIEDYRLEVFTFGYNADLEKVEFMLEGSIFKEICNGTSNALPYVVLSNNEKLLDFLEALFSSKRFSSILSGLMKIAEANKADKK